MIYIEYEENGKVLLIHNKPFDEKHGLGKTESELLETGVLVESRPIAEQIENKNAILYYSNTDGLYYVYEDVELTVEQQQIKDLKDDLALTKAAVDELIGL